MDFESAMQKAALGFVMARPGWLKNVTASGPDEDGNYPIVEREPSGEAVLYEPTDEDHAATDWSVK